MYDREHDIEHSLLSNSEGVIVVDSEGGIVVDPNSTSAPNDPMIINLEGIDDGIIESNDNVISEAIVTNVIGLRQPMGPSGMIEEILRQVPVEDDLPSAVMMIDTVQPNEPAEMINDFLRPLPVGEEIVLIRPDLSVPLTAAETDLRLANLQNILEALLMEKTNLLNSRSTTTEAVTPIRTGLGNSAVLPVEIDEDEDSKPAAIISPNQNESIITTEMQENMAEEYDSKHASVETVVEVENKSEDDISVVVPVQKTKKKPMKESTNEDNDDDDIGTGTVVTLPFLEDGYDWIQLDPPDIYNPVNHAGEPKQLPHDLMHQSNATTDAHARNYCLFLNETPTPALIMNYKSLIQRFKKNYQEYIYEIIYKFWFDIANQLEINRNGEEIRDTKQLHMAIARLRSKDECRNVLIMMYIVFDFLIDYQEQIKHLIEKKISHRGITITNNRWSSQNIRFHDQINHATTDKH